MDLMTDKELADLRNQALEYQQSGKAADALAGYEKYLAQKPEDAIIWTNLGALFRQMKQHDKARIAQVRAYALAPTNRGIVNNFANILNDLGEHERSIALRERILAKYPDDLQQRALIGRSLRSLARYKDAIAFLKPAHQENPDYAEIEIQLAFAYFSDGQFDKGLHHYKSRWRIEESKAQRSFDFPLWDGEDLTGKRVLVVPEQGFGDGVLMTRFLPALRAQAAEVHLMCEKPLNRLFQTLDGVDWVGSQIAKDAVYDCWMTVMDLPRISMKSPADTPVPSRLNVPEDSRDRAIAMTEAHKDKFKIGVVWSGSTTFKGNAFRSFDHQEFLALADIPQVQMFSLYKGAGLEAFKTDGTSALIINAAETDRDFADCAGMMQQMDLVITSDTATAHIAGSLGVPVWCLLHWDPFWFFGHAGESTHWYPSMRLFRQSKPMDWPGLFQQVRQALIAHLNGKSV